MASEDFISEGRRSVFQGHHLEAYQWKPEETPRALLCICHAINEHMGRYEKLIGYLKSKGILVFGIDLVGHGNSEGVRGHIDEIQSYVTDVRGFTEDMKVSYPDIPMFLMGHSMGGLIAIMLAIQSDIPFNGLVLLAPLIVTQSNTIGYFKKLISRVLSWMSPTTGVFTIYPELISSIPHEIKAYSEDPLVIHLPAKASVGSAIMNAVSEYEKRLGEISIPLLVMHGSADQLLSMDASALVYCNSTSEDKILEVFPDSCHEVLHDKDQKRARELITTWILARLFN